MAVAVAVCPHCKQDNARGAEHCPHWVCAKDDDILKFLVAAYVAKDYDPQKVEQYRDRYMVEIKKWAIESGDAWFTRLDDAEKMRRRLQQSMVAMAMTSFKVK
jgi:hypothetical protein